MAAFNKINVFTKDLAEKVHNLSTDAIKVYLTNATPLATNSIKTDVAEISTGNGYTGPVSVTPVGSAASGTYTLKGTMVVITASGSVGPFRYVMLYNDTPTSPVDPLIGWWDYGSALTLNAGETFSIKFNNNTVSDNILTIA